MTLAVIVGADVDPLRQPVDLPVRHAVVTERLGLDPADDHKRQLARFAEEVVPAVG